MNRNKSLNKNVVQMTLSALNRARPVNRSLTTNARSNARAAARPAGTASGNEHASEQPGRSSTDFESIDFTRDPAEVLEDLLLECEIADSDSATATATSVASVARPRDITDPFCVPYSDADVIPLSDDFLNISSHSSPNLRRGSSNR